MTDLAMPHSPAPVATAAVLPTIARVLLAAIFLLSGFGKIADPAGTIGYISSAGLPLPTVSYFGAVAVEMVFGAMLVVGYRARAAAASLAAFTIVAGLLFHSNFGDQSQFVHLLKNIAIAGGLLQIVAFGSGYFSLDRRR